MGRASATALWSWRSPPPPPPPPPPRPPFASRRRSSLPRTKPTSPWMRWKNRSLSSKRTRSRWSLSHRRYAMWNGTVESIHVASVAEGPPQSVAQAVAIPGAGLWGDRYALQLSSFFEPEPDHDLTLLEVEAIEALRRDYRV